MDVACGGSVPDSYGEPKPSYTQPEQVLDGGSRHAASITTSCGRIDVQLYSSESPVTANNFAFLASEGFYDGTVVHRVVPGFVVQMGDPTGTGTGGPGYRFADELAAARNRGYARGTLAMANAGPDTNGSQFFICLDDVNLPPQYTVFGEVSAGMEVVDAIAQLPLRGENPEQTVFVERVELKGRGSSTAAGRREPGAPAGNGDGGRSLTAADREMTGLSGMRPYVPSGPSVVRRGGRSSRVTPAVRMPRS